MKKLVTLALAATFLIACKSGDSEGKEGEGESAKGTTFSMTSSNDPLDKFEKKSAVAFKSGMNWNGKRFQPVMYLAVSNQEEIKFNKMWLNVQMPEKEGEVIIVFQLSGNTFDKGTEPSVFEAGDYVIGGDNFNSDMNCSANVYMKGKAANLMMQTSTSGKSFNGMAKITKLTSSLIEGTIELTGEDGTTVKCEFSEKIAHDFWESEFKGGKL